MKRICWVMIAFGFAVLAVTKVAAADRPNILVISVDAMRPDHMSCFGYGRKTTPHLDPIALQGVMFSDAQTAIPLTNPAVVSFFSSRYPYETGATRNGLSVKPEIELLPAILHNQGYNTAGVAASWPLGHPRSGIAKHFDYYEDQLRDKVIQGYPLEREAEWTTRRARKILAQGLREPFFFWMHCADPHQPHDLMKGFVFDPDPSGKSTKVMDAYDSELAYTDHWIGVLLEDFRERGLLKNTLIIIMADHGENLGEKTFVGHGRWLFQNILHIPFTMTGPGLPRGKKISDPIHIIDFAPTILGYLGLPQGAAMEGRDLMPRIREDRPLPLMPMFSETYGIAVFNVFPGVKQLAGLSRPSTIALRSGHLKVTYTFKSRSWMMVDLAADPGETQDLMSANHQAFLPLAQQLQAWYYLRSRPKNMSLPL